MIFITILVVPLASGSQPEQKVSCGPNARVITIIYPARTAIHLRKNEQKIRRYEPKDSKNETRIVKGVDFRVQISSSSKKVKTASYNFKGLKGVERIKIGAHHKYYYGKTSDYNQVKKLQKEARNIGFRTAFVVAFKNDKKVSVAEVLKSN